MPALKRRAFLAAAQAPVLMYPQAETFAGRMHSLDPDCFRHTITVRELPAA